MSRAAAIAAVVLLAYTAPMPAQTPPAPPLPDDAQYVSVRDGKLFLEGRRARFWGAIGSFPGKNHADNEAVVQRLKAMGFNMVRYWRPRGPWQPYVKGDGSEGDLVDHFVYCLKKQGMHVWVASLNSVGKATAGDVGVIDDPATAEAWKEAMGAEGQSLRNNAARFWDPRLEAVAIGRMKEVADHVNLWTGLRWGDDPVCAVWELSNEEWWLRRLMRGSGDKLPAFLQQGLKDRWNGFLKRKYGSDDKLREAWRFLLPGESLDRGSVEVQPLQVEAEFEPWELGLDPKAQGSAPKRYRAEDFAAARGSDVLEFLMGLWVAHKQKEHDAVKSWGKSCRLAPLVWDTGIGNSLPHQWGLQHGDAIAHCTYLLGIHPDPRHQRFPWYSNLEEPPRLAPNREWITVEHNRMEGKPYFIYETQIHNPAKYRGEYPMRIAALGATQDWDIVCWHYFGGVPDSTQAEPYTKALDYTPDTGHIQGLHYQYDEVQMSAMRAAAAIFLQGLLAPAPSPTRFTFGRRSLYSMDMIHYQGDMTMPNPAKPGSFTVIKDPGDLFLPTTYRYGVRLLIDPGREFDELAGPTIMPRFYEGNPIRPTGQIEYDTQRGHLKFDAPAVAMYSGFFAQHGGPVRFTNGVELRDVEVRNPAGTPYPVGPDEKYLTFAAVATDGQPLGQSSRVLISAMSTSFNTGFKLDESKIRSEFWWACKGATVAKGGLPVLVSRVAATVELPMLAGRPYRLLDWHLRPIAAGKLDGPRLTIPGDQPVFLIEID